jgi:hypothetical protein
MWAFALAAIVVAIIGWLGVNWLAPVFTASLIAVFPIAWVVSTLLLMVAYYLVLTPIALILRFIGRDALDRRFGTDQDSYWAEKPMTKNPQRYFRQF